MVTFSELLSSSNSLTFSLRRGVCVLNFFVLTLVLLPTEEGDRVVKAGIAMKTSKPATESMAIPTIQKVYCDDDKSILSAAVTDVMLYFAAAMLVFPTSTNSV